MATHRVATRADARHLAGKLTKETSENWLVKEHDGYFEVVSTKFVPNFKVGDRVTWKEAPGGIVGLVRKEGIGPDKIVAVYWGTQDGREFIGNIPSRQLELDAETPKTDKS